MSDENGATTGSLEAPPLLPPPNEYLLSIAFVSFVVFTSVQTVVSIKIAHSAAMLADCAAMFVDAATYGLNLWAERKKAVCAPVDGAAQIDPIGRRRSLLLLELVPPLFSVTTLLVVTALVSEEALGTLFPDAFGGGDPEEDPDALIMLLFSVANLVLDFINVFFFARAGYLFGFMGNGPSSSSRENPFSSPLIDSGGSGGEDITRENELGDGVTSSSMHAKGNLNMCSAYTHLFADTLRSAAVILAALLVLFYNVDGTQADAVAALVVSLVIVLSLVPLFKGLFNTSRELMNLSQHEEIRDEVLS
eukprot:CAMPEP_0194317212 /NCGR_PEP_ID=MMETSP0171-20130528/13956_1 /TAXON_ID=218684 /ORGANISM="Corethron pennatum, Strain L29A3" /LENGTH=305 /DNA_ID=CAMNT_0039073717 /DNA_START=150 /DNA_END=1067 /DNA_ORIENTATION=+